MVGVAAAAVAVALSGTLVTDVDGVTASLDRDPLATSTSDSSSGDRSAPGPAEFSGDDLLSTHQVENYVPGRKWQELETSDNTNGDGLVLPCQQSRYADPRGTGALLRTFRTTPRKGGEEASVFQLTEISESGRSARRAYDTSLEWYAGCTDRRLQLMTTRRVTAVGDSGSLLVLGRWPVRGRRWSWASPAAARSRPPRWRGLRAETAPSLSRAARLAAAAVNGVCARPEAGECASRPGLKGSAPVPVGDAPGMLAEVDLPPVTRVMKPWVGTEPRRASVNVAATGCDNTAFTGKQIATT